ncbi:MAG TPA: TIGR04282 family arsenosugar biosynthesis glycosyltransferase [Elusimicrobiota bacterium]|nr:TIGR04282 family arsenosugar biosynthesis glycosyltransferase [Elusimicrobiota bacterium]
MTASKNAIVVFAKAPVPGRVKTRLCPPLSFQQAAELYRAFIQDTLACVRRMRPARLAVAYDADGPSPELDWLMAQPGFEFFPQEGVDLGERLIRSFERIFRDGAEKALIIGSDAPRIHAGLLARALDSLDQNDIVLGPAADGGYYLIALKELRSDLFHSIPWSTDKVLEATIERAEHSGLKVSLLPSLADIDTFADVGSLTRDLRRLPRNFCPQTRGALQNIVLKEANDGIQPI